MTGSTPMPGEQLFWRLVEPMYADPAVRRSTMMGLPCVRVDGQFFASLDRRTGALLVKLPREWVRQLIADGIGEAFAPVRPRSCRNMTRPASPATECQRASQAVFSSTKVRSESSDC